ncbi:hypothetical protein [Brevundimonas diminuta]|uniref:hypothetical protein n=1 Tax=Brevundimonas diminuta TaxID=293 RepID=UPI001F5A1F09|nr:hypothetical protein [Brevundimonas diminuta]NSX32786.1 hypothetical protein [Brevundimonas vesicularis]
MLVVVVDRNLTARYLLHHIVVVWIVPPGSVLNEVRQMLVFVVIHRYSPSSFNRIDSLEQARSF